MRLLSCSCDCEGTQIDYKISFYYYFNHSPHYFEYSNFVKIKKVIWPSFYLNKSKKHKLKSKV